MSRGKDPSPLYVYDFSGGFEVDPALNIAWSYTFTGYRQRNLFAIGDVDNDGSDEVVLDRRHELQILNGEDGTVQRAFFTKTTQMAFDYMTLVNVDADAQTEVVALGGVNIGTHTAVYVYDALTDTIQWRYEYPRGSTNGGRFVENTVADLDGDGAVEVILGVYNDTDTELNVPGGATEGDADDWDNVNYPGEWVTIIYNGNTGVVIDSLENRIPAVVVDSDGDGVYEIVVQTRRWRRARTGRPGMGPWRATH